MNNFRKPHDYEKSQCPIKKDLDDIISLQTKFCPCKIPFCKIIEQNVSYCHRRDL